MLRIISKVLNSKTWIIITPSDEGVRTSSDLKMAVYSNTFGTELKIYIFFKRII